MRESRREDYHPAIAEVLAAFEREKGTVLWLQGAAAGSRPLAHRPCGLGDARAVRPGLSLSGRGGFREGCGTRSRSKMRRPFAAFPSGRRITPTAAAGHSIRVSAER